MIEEQKERKLKDKTSVKKQIGAKFEKFSKDEWNERREKKKKEKN